MKAASVSEIKKELGHIAPTKLIDIILKLSRFKKENKELITYLLFESDSESHYVSSVKSYIIGEFETINTTNYYYIKKSVRKILKQTKTFIRYSNVKETEVELLLFFCENLISLTPNIFNNKTLSNLFDRQINLIKNKIKMLHEDLQFDFNLQKESLLEQVPSNNF